jgi:2-oxoglutarate dehydrogenase E2 component (dihydrolipoamide succinyltransferase)
MFANRIIYGRELSGFLVTVKRALENPLELLMDNNPKKALEL